MKSTEKLIRERGKALEEENESLKNELDNVKASYETEAEAKYYEYIDKHESKLQERINKAIEYIKSKARNNCWIDQYEASDLIKILQGEDNE